MHPKSPRTPLRRIALVALYLLGPYLFAPCLVALFVAGPRASLAQEDPNAQPPGAPTPVPIQPLPTQPEPVPINVQTPPPGLPILNPGATFPGGAIPGGGPGGAIPGGGPGGAIPGGGPGGNPTFQPSGPTSGPGGLPPAPTLGGSPPPGSIPLPGGTGQPGIPGGGFPVSGGAATTFRVTQERVLGPIGAMRERGRTLFASRTLGRVSLACATCHRPDDLRPVARVYPRFNPFLRDVATLEQAQNACLTRFMRGSPLPYWSRNAVALSIYLVGE